MIVDFIVSTIVNVLALVVTLGILVTIHEFGHFWVARRCGVKVLRFSIGFGKAVKTWHGKDGVEYVIAPIPLGGYVKMLGQEDTQVADQDQLSDSEKHLSFAFKPLWQRTAIVAAGPIANFILAAVVFWFINVTYGTSGIAPIVANIVADSPASEAGLMPGDEILAVDGVDTVIWQQVSMQLLARLGETGNVDLTVLSTGANSSHSLSISIENWMKAQLEPRPVSDLGIVQFEIPAIIAGLIPGARAEQAGLLSEDEIISVDGVEIRGWVHWVEVIRGNPELDLELVVKRGNSLTNLVLRPQAITNDTGEIIGSIGAYVAEKSLAELLPPEMLRQIDYNVFSAVIPAIRETADKSIFILDSVKKMVVGLISVKNINGPITIAQVAGETASYGFDVYLSFLALLSISLGVMNLLPIPVLDGGHLLYYLIEAVTRRPVPQRVQAWGLQLGLLMISGVMMLAVYNDISRLL